jgi:uncharacterized membrane protein
MHNTELILFLTALISSNFLLVFKFFLVNEILDIKTLVNCIYYTDEEIKNSKNKHSKHYKIRQNKLSYTILIIGFLTTTLLAISYIVG